MTGDHRFTDEDVHRDLALQAACDNDIPLLKDLLAKCPITAGDDTWLGYMMEDYMGHLKPEGAQLLVDAGLNLNVSDYGFLPLHVAIDRGGKLAVALVEVLLKGGANPNLHGFNNWTALHRAACCQPANTDLMLALLRGGADPTIRTNIDNYATPAEEARRLGHPQAAAFIDAYRVETPPKRRVSKSRPVKGS